MSNVTATADQILERVMKGERITIPTKYFKAFAEQLTQDCAINIKVNKRHTVLYLNKPKESEKTP